MNQEPAAPEYPAYLGSVPAVPYGRIHTCPHGLAEIAVPVKHDGISYGVLLGGQLWMQETSPPSKHLIVPEDSKWVEDRLRLMICLAGEIARTLSKASFMDTRASRIEAFVNSHLQHPLKCNDLAKEIHLSSSRTRHIVREYFGMSFTQLVNTYRLQRAAILLESTELTVGAISAMVGFCDQAYMTRLFSRRYNMSPGAWRRHAAIGENSWQQ